MQVFVDLKANNGEVSGNAVASAILTQTGCTSVQMNTINTQVEEGVLITWTKCLHSYNAKITRTKIHGGIVNPT